MANFCIEIPDENVERVVSAVCANYKYRAQVENPNFNSLEGSHPDTNPELIDNPETAGEFANRMTRDFLINHTRAHEVRQAKQDAINNISTSPVIINPGV